MRRNPLRAEREAIFEAARIQARGPREQAAQGESQTASAEAGYVNENTGEVVGYGLLDWTPLGDGQGSDSEEFILA